MCTYTQQYYSAIKISEIVPLAATGMIIIEIIILSKVCQIEKNKEEYKICLLWNS